DNQNFYPLYGQGFGTDEPSTLAVRPVIKHVIQQDGATFTMQVKTGCPSTGIYCFDQYGQPTSVTKSSSLGFSKNEITEYHNDTALWVLGQSSKLSVDGKVEPPRDSWRLQLLRGWSHDQASEVFPGSPGAGGADGA